MVFTFFSLNKTAFLIYLGVNVIKPALCAVLMCSVNKSIPSFG